MKKVIGIVGKIGTGKDMAGLYISNKFSIPIFSPSLELKKICIKSNKIINRMNLIELGHEIAKKYGNDYLIKKILEENNELILIIVGMRQIEMIEYLRKNTVFTLIALESSREKQLERIILRNKDGDPKTINDLIKLEYEENYSGVQKENEFIKLADYVIENNGNIKSLYNNIDKLIQKIL